MFVYVSANVVFTFCFYYLLLGLTSWCRLWKPLRRSCWSYYNLIWFYNIEQFAFMLMWSIVYEKCYTNKIFLTRLCVVVKLELGWTSLTGVYFAVWLSDLHHHPHSARGIFAIFHAVFLSVWSQFLVQHHWEGDNHWVLCSICPFSTFSLSSSNYIYLCPSFCDGFSSAMLNFSNRSFPTAQSPSLWPCLTGVVRWWTGSSWNIGLGEERACCVRRKLGGGGAEGRGGEKSATWVFHESGRLCCYAF